MKTNEMSFKKDELGNQLETTASVKKRISNKFGFKLSEIILLEASSTTYTAYNGLKYSYYTTVAFQVKGIGYSASFTEASQYLVMNEAYNA